MSGFLVSFLSTSSIPSSSRYRSTGGCLDSPARSRSLTCVIFGLTPALRATHAAPVAAMKASSRTVTDSRERFGLRRALVVVQVALSLVLMVGALLFVRSLTNLRSADLGFNPDGLLVASLDLRRAPVPQDRRIAQYRDIRDRLRRTPGVAAAGARSRSCRSAAAGGTTMF